MSILSGPAIRTLVERTRACREAGIDPPLPLIDIDPFDPARCGPNSYDVTLAPELLVYEPSPRIVLGWDGAKHILVCLDMRDDNPTRKLTIPDEGLVLNPGRLYLGSTVERTECQGLAPWLDGRSSVGRLGMTIHVTAGRGDDGYGAGPGGPCSWTLEISVVEPLRVYAGVRIGQLSFFALSGERKPYAGKYKTQSGPVPSGMWKDFLPPTIVEAPK